MKHPPILRLLATLLLALTATAATAYDFEVDGIYYYKNDDGTSVSVTYGRNSYTGSVTIPSQVIYSGKTYSVTSIGYEAFRNCSGLTSVTIPNSVTEIGQDAFYECSGLTSVTIPNSVTSIGDLAFYGCSGLTSVTIPTSVTEIGSQAFYGCSGLTSVTIPNSVTSIGYWAFRGCSSLTSVTIPDSVTSIGSGAFDDTPFYNNQPDGVVYLGRVLYKYKGSMPQNTSISIKEGTVSISPSAFSDCTGLTSVTIPNSVTSIGNYAFDYCSRLTWVTIPNSVTEIGSGAFRYCSSLTSVTIPNSVTYIGEEAFSGCRGLEQILVDSGNSNYDSRDNCNAIIEKSTNTLIAGCKNTIIPNSVTWIGDYAFSGCTGLTSVTIPNSVTSIGYEAFNYCRRLTSVTIPNSVTSIGDYAFDGCSGLSTIEYDSNNYCDFSYIRDGLENKIRFIYGNSVTTANTQFLHDLQPVSVTIGTNVSSIEGSSYKPTKTIWLTNTPPEGCEKVKGTVNYVSNDKYSADWNTEVYSYLSSWFEVDGVVYVPVVPSERTCDAIDVCHGILPPEVTLGEATFNGITLNVKNVSQYTFSGCDQLTSITLSEGITYLGYYALNGCSKITELTIPSTVNYIGHFAFNKCTYLSKFTISDRNTELLLGSNGSSPLFADCPLKEIYIGGNIAYSTDEADGYSPFYRNTTLKTVVITDEETEISDNEFYGCTKLANVTMGDGVERIGNWAFSGCSSLNQLQFGTGMKTIGDEAFSDCANVTAIYSYTAVPPVCGTQALDDINKWTCKLYVPDGHIPAYQAADQWKEFFYIYGGNEDVTIDGGVEVCLDGGVLHCGGVDSEVYNLSGVQVYSGCGDVELAAGAYIVVANGRATKVVVK